MKIAALLALVLAAAPAVAAGRGRSATARGSRLSLNRPLLGRSSFAFRSFAQTRFASRATFTGGGSRAASSSGSRATRMNSATGSTVTGNVPTNGGSTATRGNWGTPTAGTMNNSTAIGGPNGAGTQSVAGGDIAQNPGTAVGTSGPGVTWAPPSAPTGTAGGGGVTTNNPNPGF